MTSPAATRSQRWQVLRRSATFWVGASIIVMWIFFAIFGDVALLAVPLLFLTHGWPPPARPAIGRAAVGDDSGEPALMTMLEPRRRGALLAVCSEDHYVRIYTDRADQLIAMQTSSFGRSISIFAELK